jgi:hypothetical protein
MRMILNVTIPHEPFNSYVRDGSAGAKIQKILDTLKPEAVYFTEQDGKRGAIVVVDLPADKKVPALAEPWFLTFNADVKLRIAMTPDDLKHSGIDGMGKQWA